MTLREVAAAALMAGGVFFFIAGTIGVLRFRDARSRLHAVTKADTLGLGLIAAGLVLLAGSVPVILKLALVWLLAMTSSSVASYFIAGSADVEEERQ